MHILHLPRKKNSEARSESAQQERVNGSPETLRTVSDKNKTVEL